MEKFVRTGQVTDDNTVGRMRFAITIAKVTDTHTHTQYM